MPWVRIEDSLYDHPKVLACSMAAVGSWFLCLGYASNHLTDGFIPVAAFRICRGTPKAARELEAAGLFEAAPGGWRIHDFLDYNPSREETVAKRRAISQERSKAGSKGAAKRWQTDGPVPTRTRPVTDSRSTKEPERAGDVLRRLVAEPSR